MASERAYEVEIRRRIEGLVEAIRAANLEGVKAIYAPDIVSFDVIPPLQHRGAEAQWKNREDVFTAYQHPVPFDPETGRAALDLEP